MQSTVRTLEGATDATANFADRRTFGQCLFATWVTTDASFTTCKLPYMQQNTSTQDRLPQLHKELVRSCFLWLLRTGSTVYTCRC